jgi:signal transduction histidine kinase
MIQSVSLMPHAVCWAADPQLIWTMVVTNAVTFVSYLTICFTLLGLMRRTKVVIARDWRYFLVGFALFIVACGATHLMEVVTTWSPLFWIDAWTNIVTAILSAWVALNLLQRVGIIGKGINDYSARLASTEEEKRQVENSLISAQRLEEWSRMSTVLAHEINNPLESVANLLYLVRTGEGVTPDAAHYAATAAEEIARVIEMTRATLSFFRQDNRPEQVDLGEAAEAVRFLVQPLAQRFGVQIEIHRLGDLHVQSYPGEVRQVLLNLVRNACEASSRPGSRVAISLDGQAEGVVVVVSDQGTGIDPELLPRLFQFGASTKGAAGNGMGLWTVKRILERHSGTITVESEPGRGTSFMLVWPRTIAEHRAGEPSLTEMLQTRASAYSASNA